MSEEPIITIENGSLKGKIQTDYEGNSYYSFQGIPYAKPPIGNLRFKAPQPAESWSGIKDATKEGNPSYAQHIISKTNVGSEDCLFLNVFTKELPSSSGTLKPVMFWIHGGGFIMGAGDSEFYGPDYLISQDVVLVTINYRLGLLGFLSFEDVSLKVPGNAGLKDQVMALKWVNKNIAHFGGDPNNVTIFGVSAGGASVHYLTLSPLAKGLFHNAILQSGTALSLWAKGQRTAAPISSALGKENMTEADVYKILCDMTTAEIMELQNKIPDMLEIGFYRIFCPVIENKNAKEPFLSEDLLDIIRSGKQNHVPMMIGYTSREGMFYEAEHKRTRGELKFSINFESAIPHDLNVPNNSECSKSLGEKIKKFYYGMEEPSLKNIDPYYLLQGDALFVNSVYSTIKLHNQSSVEPIYLYRMSVESKLNLFKRLENITNPGVSHGDDLGYLFTNFLSTPLIPNSVENISMKRFIKLWTTFAKTGDPNPKQEEDLITITWKPIETNKFHYLEIGENLTVGLNADKNRLKFWDELYSFKPHKCDS